MRQQTSLYYPLMRGSSGWTTLCFKKMKQVNFARLAQELAAFAKDRGVEGPEFTTDEFFKEIDLRALESFQTHRELAETLYPSLSEEESSSQKSAVKAKRHNKSQKELALQEEI